MRLAVAVFACLCALPVCAANLFVTEFAAAPPVSVYYQAAKAPAIANQVLAIGGTSVPSVAFGLATGLVRIHADVACHVVMGGTSPIATSSSMRLSAGQTEYFVVLAGDKLAVIQD